ncbi:SOS response-associated peptidase family protein [Synechococcus sp. J7-Johnson]|uniref:SOS response-associated peptidase family protein n=1 Tax=Synechococcus sp. J7-Johnson TaxID=2823737 RepID=UPI0020CE4F97|nr:SOS response-associated peptidase family protein [Synechococcus sp. J7-Johnson]
MCGRYSLTTTIDQLLPRLKGPLPEGLLEHYQPRQQVRPGEPLLIQRQQHGRPEVGFAQWGLVPSWLNETRGKSRSFVVPGAITTACCVRSTTECRW